MCLTLSSNFGTVVRYFASGVRGYVRGTRGCPGYEGMSNFWGTRVCPGYKRVCPGYEGMDVRGTRICEGMSGVQGGVWGTRGVRGTVMSGVRGSFRATRVCPGYNGVLEYEVISGACMSGVRGYAQITLVCGVTRIYLGYKGVRVRVYPGYKVITRYSLSLYLINMAIHCLFLNIYARIFMTSCPGYS